MEEDKARALLVCLTYLQEKLNLIYVLDYMRSKILARSFQDMADTVQNELKNSSSSDAVRTFVLAMQRGPDKYMDIFLQALRQDEGQGHVLDRVQAALEKVNMDSNSQAKPGTSTTNESPTESKAQLAATGKENKSNKTAALDGTRPGGNQTSSKNRTAIVAREDGRCLNLMGTQERAPSLLSDSEPSFSSQPLPTSSSSEPKILIICGWGQRESIMEVFSPSSGSTFYKCLPGRYGHSVAWVPDRSRILVTGGYPEKKNCIFMNPTNLRQPAVALQSLPVPKYRHGSATLQGGVLVYGGWAHSDQPSAESLRSGGSYLFADERWVSVRSTSKNRTIDSCFAGDGHFAYAIGGRGFLERSNTAERFDPVVNRWMPLPTLPENKAGCAAAFHDSRIFLTGGYFPARSICEFIGLRKRPSNSVISLDPRENNWQKAPPMCIARHCHCLVSASGSLFALGGYDNDTGKKVEIFDTRANKWQLLDRDLRLSCWSSAAVAL